MGALNYFGQLLKMLLHIPGILFQYHLDNFHLEVNVFNRKDPLFST